MQNIPKKKKYSGLIFIVFLVWFIMNVRVEAGIATTFERAVDGLVGISLFVTAVFFALDFFQVIGDSKRDGGS